MNGIDKLLRARIEEWLGKKDHTEDELAQGATMMLQCNRNMAMYNTVMRKPRYHEGKIIHELKKHLTYLKDDMNLEEVKGMEKTVLTEVGQALQVETSDDKPLPSPALFPEEPYEQTSTVVARGKRSDHETLPDDIRAIWDKNAERYKKMKQAHETAKTLTAACDRYEFVKAIAELWADYKKDFDTYDHYVAAAAGEDGETASPAEEKVQLSADDLKAIKAARPYISKNLPKLLALVAAAKEEGFTGEQAQELESLRDRIQQRVDLLIRTKQVITDELKVQLTEADITLETDSDEQGQEHQDDTPATE